MDVKEAVKNQSMIFDIFKQAKRNNRLSHAYLFYGEEGVGKKEMAYALACLLYCPNEGCLECEVCKSIIGNQHMNVDYIGVDKTKTMISKEQITALQEEFSKTSLVEGSRIYIVDGIDTASVAAQNSLLKFIEEPVNREPTVGVFLAKELSNIVPTILSRCALQHFKALPLNKSVEMLISEGIDAVDAVLCASLTNNPGEASAFSKTEEFRRTKELFLQLLEISKPKEAVLYYLQNGNFFSESKNLTVLLQWFLLFLEDANIAGDSKEGLILSPLYDKIVSYRNRYKQSLKNRLAMLLSLFDKLKYNVSAKNVFHELMTKIL